MDVMVWNVAGAQIPLLSDSCEYCFAMVFFPFFSKTLTTSCVDDLLTAWVNEIIRTRACMDYAGNGMGWGYRREEHLLLAAGLCAGLAHFAITK